MGVHGLWRLIEPSGRPVPLETLENKVLAVDVSIWLHQLIKGFQDTKGAPIPNAHLLGIYHRLCKLLYFRIKPVFVFDGGVPVLKKQTIAKRNQQKSKNLTEADRIHKNLLSTLLKHSAVSKVLSEKAKAAITSSTSPTKKSKKEDDLYALPPTHSLDSTLSSTDNESSSDETPHLQRQYDLHSIDTESVQFKSLPADVRHEILTDLKETRKQSSWGRINELPTESDDFSVYQMRRLLKRQSVQNALEEVEKEMGGHSLSLGELEKILKDQGVIARSNVQGNRIASDENTRFLLIKDIKQAVEDAKKQNGLQAIEEGNEEKTEDEKGELHEKAEGEPLVEEEESEEGSKNKGQLEFEDDLQRAIALSLEEIPSTSKPVVEEVPEKTTSVVGGKGKNKMPLSFLENFEDARFDDSDSSEEEIIQTKFTSAHKYMMEYTTLTSSQINKIIASKTGIIKKSNVAEEKNITKPSVGSITEVIESDENLNVKDSVVDTEVNVEQASDKKESTAKEIMGHIEEPKFIESSKEETIKVMNGTEDNALETKGGREEVEVMSDSESSGCDDFLEVEETSTVKTSTVEPMEVVIKLNEEIEDDLFKDIFSDTDKSIQEEITTENEISHTTSKDNLENIVESNEKTQDKGTEEMHLDREPAEDKSKDQSGTLTLKDKIERMIKSYSKAKTDGVNKSELSLEQLNEISENIRIEEMELVTARSNKERLAGNITDQMCQEAQELLELFGVPYIVAPMEAEAQCAFLDLIDLTDGTITDDSDIWLFGGRTVYKNFFNQSKTVLEFKSENIHHHYKLTREQMVLLAMLVGSDYTVGLPGVGPVTALEILAAFPPKNELESGLAEFKSWFNKGKAPGPGRTSLRSKLKNLNFTENFPNRQIVQAYLEPQVETSKEKFSWAKPDVVGLVEFCRQKFGWTKVKTEEILKPILKRMEDHSKQKSILNYFQRNYIVDSGATEQKMSKRVKTAINKIGRNINDEVEEEEEPKPKKRKQAPNRKNNEVGESGKPSKKPKQKAIKKCEVDEDIAVLKETEERSQKRVEEITKEVQQKIEERKVKPTVDLINWHRKEVIPQKQKEQSDILKTKLKAIEAFRKSKKGPGYVKKRGKVVAPIKSDTSYLSESSNSD